MAGALGRAHDASCATSQPWIGGRRPGAAPATGAPTAGGRRRPASPHGRWWASQPATLVASVLLPTPPLGLAITITGMPLRPMCSMCGYGSGDHEPHRPDRRPPAAGALTRQCAPDAPRRRDAAEVEVRDLYALYPDYWIDRGRTGRAGRRAKLVVWLHPVHWYGMPPLMKLWLDDVFSLRLGLRPRRPGAAGQGPVAGGLHRWPGRELPARRPPWACLRRLPAAVPADRGVDRHALLPPLVQHGAHRLDDTMLAAHVRTFVERLSSYPDWPEIAELAATCRRTRGPPRADAGPSVVVGVDRQALQRTCRRREEQARQVADHDAQHDRDRQVEVRVHQIHRPGQRGQHDGRGDADGHPR
jgi:glutathione-regulated potassium-efflux system ancillary protein KefF